MVSNMAEITLDYAISDLQNFQSILREDKKSYEGLNLQYTELEIQFRSSYYTVVDRILKYLSKLFSLEGVLREEVAN